MRDTQNKALWCTKGYYNPLRSEISYHNGIEIPVTNLDEDKLSSLGEVICTLDESLSYENASWRVRFSTFESYDAAARIHCNWAGRWERFQDVPKCWRTLYESCSEQELFALVEALNKPASQIIMWTSFRDEFLSSPYRTPDWVNKVKELLLLKPSAAWRSGAFGWIHAFGLERAWKLLSSAPSIWEASDLANDIWEISENNSLPLKLPSNWVKAQKYKRKLVQKYEGWDPDVIHDLPLLNLNFQVIEGVEVQVLRTTQEMIETGRQYNNCLKMHVRRALDGTLHIWEIKDITTGEGAILGFEEKEGGWESSEMLFKGVDDIDVCSSLLHQQKRIIGDALNE